MRDAQFMCAEEKKKKLKLMLHLSFLLLFHYSKKLYSSFHLWAVQTKKKTLLIRMEVPLLVFSTIPNLGKFFSIAIVYVHF